MIEFKGTEALRAGRSIEELQRRQKLSHNDFAAKAKLSPEYLTLLKEGHEPKVADVKIERILAVGGICKKGNKYSSEELKMTLLSIVSPVPPEGRLL